MIDQNPQQTEERQKAMEKNAKQGKTMTQQRDVVGWWQRRQG